MAIDTAAILAAQFKKDPTPLREAVLGQGQSDINPYAALRALQLQKEAERYQMAQAAMQGQQYQNQPSMVEQALQSGQPQMPQQMQQMQQTQQMQQPAQGLAGMPVPEQTYAPGGIVAFNGAERSDVEDEDAAMYREMFGGELPSQGDPAVYSQMSSMLPQLVGSLAKQSYVPMTGQEFESAFTKRKEFLGKDVGESPYAAFKQQLADYDAERGQNLSQAKGLALLASAGDILQPGGLARGLGAAGKTFASIYGQAAAADKAEKRALMSMQFNLADAQRKEAMGLNKEALAAADQARVDHNAAQRFKIDKLKALSSVVASGARATRPTAGAGGPKNFDALAAKYAAADLLRNQELPENKRQPKELVEEKAYERAARDWSKISAGELMGIKGGELGVKQREAAVGETRATTEQERLEAEKGKNINEQMRKWETSREAIQSKKDGTYEEKKRQKEAEIRGRMEGQRSSDAGNKNSQQTATGGKVIPRADIKATAKARGMTEAEVEAVAKAKGYTIK